VDAFFEKIYAKATEVGGQVSGEHGIGSGKIKYLRESLGETNMQLMQRNQEGLRSESDPEPGQDLLYSGRLNVRPSRCKYNLYTGG
jgi:glycolate oxidase